MTAKLGRVAGTFTFVFLVLVARDAPAQETAEKNLRPIIRVTAEATVSAEPDQAQINIGVTTQASTAQAAAVENASKLEATLAELRKALGKSAAITTLNYSLSPNYRYPREGGQPTIAGYTASNIVQVKTGDLAQVGKLIDLAAQSGANNIQSLRFTLRDDRLVRNRALAEAAVKARGKAEAIASALNLRIIRVLQVEEGGSPTPRPLNFAVAEARVAGAPTPVESGSIDVSATVVLTVEVGQ